MGVELVARIARSSGESSDVSGLVSTACNEPHRVPCPRRWPSMGAPFPLVETF